MATLPLKTKTKSPLDSEASQFFNAFRVINDENLLTIGFRSELLSIYSSLNNPKFSKRKLLKCLDDYCKTERYLSQNRYGVRYNIDNKPTHRIVKIPHI